MEIGDRLEAIVQLLGEVSADQLLNKKIRKYIPELNLAIVFMDEYIDSPPADANELLSHLYQIGYNLYRLRINAEDSEN